MRKFNTTGLCVPTMHYMVDISGRVEQMRAMVDVGDYFCINRARQYGKTTALAALEDALAADYEVASLDFQALSHADFASEPAFVRAFCRVVLRTQAEVPADVAGRMREISRDRATEWVMGDLFDVICDWCEQSVRPVVLIVDEVDSATNNQVFLDFLAQLRQGYLRHRKRPSYPAFKSVVLAGVTDVKHLKAKIRPEDQARPNSPWNIAADFDVVMSFDGTDVAGMLAGYEADHATGMDVAAVAAEIVAWTGGYPFLVSRVCQLADERGLGWDREGLDAAVKALLVESNTLFESLSGKLEVYPGLKSLLRSVLMDGERLPYSADHDGLAQLMSYGFIRRGPDNSVRVANRVFETRLYDLFILEDAIAGSRAYSAGDLGRSRYVRGGRLDMRAVLEGFREAYGRVWGPIEEGDHFGEFDGRRQFLLFLKPIINGTGNYYIEAQTRDQTRTDVVVDYAGEQFVVELKIWRGPRYNEEGERQLRGYLDHFGLDVGYMLSFNFNKGKESGLRRVSVGDKVLWEETV
ncbi:MAG: AAA-like domain-containing protein [Atopobiaceae bacterium]|nr:AAA-like domain-containing protein [Atopobiaceae bacterium]